MLLATNIQGPEVLSDDLLRDWLAFNYIWAMDFKTDGGLMMGETGGVIPTNPNNGEQVLAISSPSLAGKVLYSFKRIREAEKTGNMQIISELEEEIEMPLEYRNGITVVNGNRNIAHYDFTTAVARESELDSLATNTGLLLSAEGFLIASNKCLDGEQYMFNIPINQRLSQSFRGLSIEDGDKKLDILRTQKKDILPKGLIAGFHVAYKGNLVRVRPVIGESELKGYEKFLQERGLEPTSSKITCLGRSGPYGKFGEICVMEGVL